MLELASLISCHYGNVPNAVAPAVRRLLASDEQDVPKRPAPLISHAPVSMLIRQLPADDGARE